MVEMEQLLRMIVNKGASDLHLTVGIPPQLRIGGQLVYTEFEPLTPEIIQKLSYSLLTGEQIQWFEEKRELDFSCGIEDVSRFRVNLYFQRGSIAMAARVIPFIVPTIEGLGLPQMVKEYAEKPNGLVLVTGATGSGKSTTQAAIIDYINKTRRAHIISIEDPIEYLHKHNLCTINQRQLGTDTLSFKEALKHVFRQDPDIVVIGEMRDLETIQAALTLAETGHLIFATLHTGSATNSISRIVDVFPAHQQQQVKVQLSLVLIGVIVQQLIPHAGDDGRSLAMEIMTVIPGIQNLIRENQVHQIYSLIQTGRRYGMMTMNQSLCDLVSSGKITFEEALKHTLDEEELTTLLKKAKP
ncbi:MAG: type IV pilus twitching motility protein PilT [Candidatus Omnitrophica bacterium]|nr:type IV pilus twitching motility protein PilT [Candidatus Omnitrophota bacterium]MBU4479090.1 type IV pilus twitching motility protein PilT [Candidatus Omnitrophota bacterium]MCG2703011.1 type IV pilus twitching motility protein PilT [Candidatus Omnitrophota bacterium]